MHRNTHRYHAADKVEQVKACIARLETSWNHHNPYLWASAFTEPCHYIDGAGNYHRDWTNAQNARQHEQVWATAFLNSRAQFLVESLEFIDDQNCMVILHCTIVHTVAHQERSMETFISTLLQHQGQEWLILYFQNTLHRGHK